MEVRQQIAPISVTLKLEGDDAVLLRHLVRSRGCLSPQNTVIGVLREFEQRLGSGQESSVQELGYRRLYFELLDQVSSLRKPARKLLEGLSHAKEAEGWKPVKKRKKR